MPAFNAFIAHPSFLVSLRVRASSSTAPVLFSCSFSCSSSSSYSSFLYLWRPFRYHPTPHPQSPPPSPPILIEAKRRHNPTFRTSYVSAAHFIKRNELQVAATKEIRDFGAQGNWQEALALLKSHKHRDSRMCNAAIEVCISSGQLRYAFDIYRNMLKTNLLPDAVTYEHLMRACAALGDWKTARDMLNKVKKEGGLKSSMFVSVIAATIKDGNWKLASTLVNEMEQQYEFKPDSQAYNALLASCANSDQYQKAFAVFNTMGRMKLKRNIHTYNNLLVACVKAQNLDAALSILKDLKRRKMGPNRTTYNACIAAAKECHELEVAFTLWDELRTQNIAPDRTTYNALMRICERDGSWEKTLELLEEMIHQAQIKPNAETIIACMNACIKGNHHEAVEELFELVKEHKIIPTLEIYYAAIVAANERQEYLRTVQLLTELMKRKLIPDKGICVQCAAAYGKLKDQNELANIIMFMKNNGWQLDAVDDYDLIIEAHRDCGLDDDAKKWCLKLEASGLSLNDSKFAQFVLGPQMSSS